MEDDVPYKSSTAPLGTSKPLSNSEGEVVIPGSAGEVARLKAELERRDAELAALTGSTTSIPAVHHQSVRKTSAGILITLTCLLSALGLIAVWMSTTVLNTDRYVTTVAPLAKNPAVQATAANRVTTQLFSQVDVEGEVKAALPPNAQALAAPLTSQIKGFVENQVVTLMSTPAFSKIWEQANRVTQTQITGLLLNKGADRVLVNSNGTVSLDLHSLVTAVVAQLQNSGVTLFNGIPTDKVQGSVELFKSSELADASKAAEALNAARYIAP